MGRRRPVPAGGSGRHARAGAAGRAPDRRRLHLAAGAHQGDGRARSPAASASRSGVERGLLECDFGEWTGAELKDLAKLPEWATVQRYPSGFRFPGGESFVGMQARMADDRRPRCAAAIPGEAVVAVSHADPIKAVVSDAARDPPRPVPADRGLALLGDRRSATSPTGPMVLAVNSTGSLTERACRS